jgi:hypothetical protein
MAPNHSRLFATTQTQKTNTQTPKWKILQNRVATTRPTASTPTTGTTAQNLKTAAEDEHTNTQPDTHHF